MKRTFELDFAELDVLSTAHNDLMELEAQLDSLLQAQNGVGLADKPRGVRLMDVLAAIGDMYRGSVHASKPEHQQLVENIFRMEAQAVVAERLKPLLLGVAETAAEIERRARRHQNDVRTSAGYGVVISEGNRSLGPETVQEVRQQAARQTGVALDEALRKIYQTG